MAGARDDVRPARPWLARLGWMVLIWAGSVAALAVVAYGIRLFMRLAHLTA